MKGTSQLPSRRCKLLFLYLSVILFLLCSSCSPVYILEAGWTEAGILWRREKISTLVEDPDISEHLKHKLQITEDARNFAVELGLKINGNFSYYSHVNRDVLVWVINATESTSLRPKTWWFPIVGNVTYKGYFEKEDAEALSSSLSQDGYDTYIRPSLAFSTLGWFDDPLLSTYLKLSDSDLIETVIHEIFHSSFWVKNDTALNETAANFVGSIGVILFFEKHFGKNSPEAEHARDSWQDELLLARFLENLCQELNNYYSKSTDEKRTKEEIIIGKNKIYENAQNEWGKVKSALRTNKYQKFGGKLNNASLLALRTYLTKPWLLEALYYQSGSTISGFITALENLNKNKSSTTNDIFSVLEKNHTNNPAEP